MRRIRSGTFQPLDAPIQPGHVDDDEAAPDFSDFAAVIWVVDPEQRHGWREYYVRRGPKPGRPMGFRKPGER